METRRDRAGHHSHDSNLIIHRDKPGGITQLRCSRKKNHGKTACPSKPIRLDTLIKHVLERLLGTILTEPALRQLIEDVARDSRKYLAEGQARKAELSKQLPEVRKRIQNISEVIQTQGTRYQGLATLLQDLAELEEKERTLRHRPLPSDDQRAAFRKGHQLQKELVFLVAAGAGNARGNDSIVCRSI